VNDPPHASTAVHPQKEDPVPLNWRFGEPEDRYGYV